MARVVGFVVAGHEAETVTGPLGSRLPDADAEPLPGWLAWVTFAALLAFPWCLW